MRRDLRRIGGYADRHPGRAGSLWFVTAAESSASVKVDTASRYRGVYANKSRSPPLSTVSAGPGLQAGFRDPP